MKKYTSNVLVAFTVAVFIVSGVTVPRVVSALSESELRSQSSALEQQIKDNLAQADNLAVEVDSLENKIASLDKDILSAQTEITQTEAKINDLTVQITETQTEIDRQKELLKENLVRMYKLSDSTSMELLLSSDDFATYVNNQEYLDTIKDGVKGSVDTIIVKKQRLEDSKKEQQQLRDSLVEKKKNLEASRSERANLLEQTKGQESEYRRMVEELRAEQKRINAEIAKLARNVSYVGTGSYPWANVAEGYWSAWDCYGSDPWGMCYRQCVSYTAWKVASTGRYMPTDWLNGKGNAKNWVPSAQEDGIPVFREPQAGDVAIYASGYYGHAMYVEEVYDNGTMLISQYNFNYDGRYSMMVLPSSRWDLYFVRFQ